jgi:hypothetical protein
MPSSLTDSISATTGTMSMSRGGNDRGGRRNTFSAGEGAENIHANKTSSTASSNIISASGAKSVSRNDAPHAIAAKEVRWSGSNSTATISNSNNRNTLLDTTLASVPTSPSQRAKDRFVDVASGKKDVVMNYHFEGTPFSQKKKRRKHHSHGNDHQQHGGSSSGSNSQHHRQLNTSMTSTSMTAAAAAANAMENTFHLGFDTTAEIRNIAAGDVSGTLDPMNESLLSLGSKSSMASNASSADSSSSKNSSGIIDPLNCTTMSDTHELSTSNFLQNVKMRNVLAERAQALYGNTSSLVGKEKNKDQKGGMGSTKQGEELGDEIVSMKSTRNNAPPDIFLGEDTMTLPDLTLNLSGLLPGVKAPAEQSRRKSISQPQIHQQSVDSDSDDVLEFTSHQRSRTPQKRRESGINRLSLLNNDGDKKVSSINDKVNTNLSKLIEVQEDETSFIESNASPTNERTETSFADSTASLNDIDTLLGDNKDDVAQSDHAKNMVQVETESLPSESTPVAPPLLNKSVSSNLCPSPSFLSGKKQRGSGIPSLRKSLGGDVSKIRKLTASLRKENEDKRRTSLPALSMMAQHHTRASSDTSSQNAVPGMNEFAKVHPHATTEKDQPSRPIREQEHSLPLSPKIMHSPARINDTKKSPLRKSPSRKSPVATSVDSPARNTRSAGKKSPLSPFVDSPAKKKRASAKKSPSNTPSSVNADSPARNTRFGSRKTTSPRHSASAASSQARSLFNSPSDIGLVQEIDSNFGSLAESIQASVRNGPFSGRKRADRANASDGSEPTQKRMSMSPESSDLSTTSLSYPFLSLSPNVQKAPSTEFHVTDSEIAIENGTQTLMFDELMQGIEAEMAETSMNDSSLRKEREKASTNGIDYVSKHARSTRRSADTAELIGILTDNAMPDDSSPKTSIALGKENNSPHTPSAASSFPSKAPKSILSSAKQRSAKPKRHVEFGSPVFAEYNIGSPSSSMTPMHPEIIRERNPMPEEEHTTELENGLERLINMGNDTSVMMDPIDEIGDSTADSSRNDALFSGAERTEELETNILHLVDNRADESAFSLPSISSVSNATSHRDDKSAEQDTSQDSSMSMVEQTQTMNIASFIGERNSKRASIGIATSEETQTMLLEGNLAFLVDRRDNNSTRQLGEETQTMQLEATLASLLEDRPGGNTDHEVTLPSLSSISPHRKENDRDIQTREECPSINIEGTMASLLEAVSEDESRNFAVHSHAVSLDNYREVLLNAASKSNMHREDDTVSELGMNTASHDLRHGTSDMQMPLEDVNLIGMTHASHHHGHGEQNAAPVDLTLNEIMNVRGIDWDRMVDTHTDILLKSLELVSKNSTCLSIQTESDKVFASICYEIESELEDIDVDSQFRAIVENNPDLMRSLQTRLRTLGNSVCEDDIKVQANLLLQSHNESQLTAWQQWLTEVAGVYNNELSTTVLPVLQQDTAVLSQNSSLVDRNREQIALPLLIRSARRAAKMNFERTMSEVSSCEDEVKELEAQVEDAERQLESLQSMHELIHNVAESNEKSDSLCQDEKEYRVSADSSYFKFFSIERLHNWVLTGSSDSFISLVFRGLSMETSIHLSFTITTASAVTLRAEFGSLPRSVTSFLNVVGAKQSKFHPAVSEFLNTKMVLLCNDLRNSQIANPSEISTMIHFAELRVARIESVAKELDSILARCKNSFLQPSDSLRNGYDFTVYLSPTSRKAERLNVILTIPDCYPFALIDTKLHSNSGQFDIESVSRQLKKATTPGFGALTAATEVLQNIR